MKIIRLIFLIFIICFFMISCGSSEQKKIDRELDEFNQTILPNSSE